MPPLGCQQKKKTFSNGEAEKKRKLYKDLLGFNSESSSAESTENSVQLNCSPPVTQSAVVQPNQYDVVKIEYRIGEVVWAKIKGSPAWPAKIKFFASSRMVVVTWFNDYRTTKIYKTQLFKFLTHFDAFAKNFDSSIGLKTAAQEALIYYGNSFYNNY